ncbi:MAG: hypothetical protein GYB53_12510 [Rhodobacteraceae bacterium]|nr:hypothetical protein [Paracoccaceae bacterium]MBR9820576.1 hypothetical protein [Paracoccaceae bacterium]
MSDRQILRVMPREMRMMSERIFSLTALPKGFALMLTDTVMYSQAMGLGGFAHLEAGIEALKDADPQRLKLTEDRDGSLRMDCGGQHAWIVLPSVLDLLGLEAARRDGARILLENLTHPEELALAEGFGLRLGLAVKVSGEVISARACPPEDPVLDRALQDGCRIPAELWWRIWALAQTALTPDSVISRRHAGVNIVTEDGQIIGRTDNDDDTDPNFINSVGLKTKEATQ